MLNEYGFGLSDDFQNMMHEVGSTRNGNFCVDESRLLSVLDKYLILQDKQFKLLQLECEKESDQERIKTMRKEIHNPGIISFLHRWDGISFVYDKIINTECNGNVATGIPRFCEYYKRVILNLGKNYAN